jgi:cytochrome c oxidase assembly protein subunit 15
LAWPLAGLFVLGGLQGAVGWWMVASGLVNQPAVSHYRLSVHLGLALAIFAILLAWSFRLLDPPRTRPAPPGLRGGAIALALLVYAQMLLGALVAGLDAGLGYNTFPDMGGAWLPAEAHELSPAWLNHLDNPAMVQFQHRLGAYLLLLAVAALWWHGRRLAPGAACLREAEAASLRRRQAWRRPLDLLATAALLQFALGVCVLLAGVPVWLGVAHQGGALALLTACLFVVHRASPIAAGKETA